MLMDFWLNWIYVDLCWRFDWIFVYMLNFFFFKINWRKLFRMLNDVNLGIFFFLVIKRFFLVAKIPHSYYREKL